MLVAFAAVLLVSPVHAHGRFMLKVTEATNITELVSEEVYRPCANAKLADDPSQAYGSTLYMLSPAEIKADTELKRRVDVLATWAKPQRQCTLASTQIKVACREDADNTPPYTDRSDYEWRATATYNCPKNKKFVQEIYQTGGGNDGVTR